MVQGANEIKEIHSSRVALSNCSFIDWWEVGVLIIGVGTTVKPLMLIGGGTKDINWWGKRY